MQSEQKLGRYEEESLGTFLQRRFARVWPLHAAVVLYIHLLSGISVHSPIQCPVFPTSAGHQMLAVLLLIQAWLPCSSPPMYNYPSWFLSCLFACWLCFRPLSRWVRRLTPGALAVFLGLCWAWSFLGYIFLLSMPDWNPWDIRNFSTGRAISFLSSHPLAVVPCYASGVALAHAVRLSNTGVLGQRSAGSVLIRLAGRWGASAGLATLGLLFWQVDHWRWWPILCHGGLLPVHGTLLVGMVQGRDPVRSLFGWRPLVLLGDLAMSIYLLHMPFSGIVKGYFWPWQLAVEGGRLPFAVFQTLHRSLLLLTACLAELLVVRPGARLLGGSRRK